MRRNKNNARKIELSHNGHYFASVKFPVVRRDGTTVWIDTDVYIDMSLVRDVAAKALDNASQRSKEAGGALIVEVVDVAKD